MTADPAAPASMSPHTFQISGDSYAFALDADGRLAQDVACITCNYNLRTTTPDSNCPECGKPVVDSLKGDRLQYAPLNWLKKVHAGTGRILLSIVGGIALTLIVIVITVLLPSLAAFSISWYVLFGIAPAVAGTGIWLVAAPDPQHATTNYRERLNRRRARAGAFVVGLLLPVLSFIPVITGMPDNDVFIASYGAFAFVTGLGVVLTAIALSSYLGRLCKRLPSAALARQFHIVAWIIGIWFILSILFFLGAMARSHPNSGSTLDDFLEFMLIIVSILQSAIPIVMIWLFVLLIVFHRRIKRIVTERKAELARITAS